MHNQQQDMRIKHVFITLENKLWKQTNICMKYVFICLSVVNTKEPFLDTHMTIIIHQGNLPSESYH